MKVLNELKDFLLGEHELIKTAISIAEANIGHGKNDEKKEFCVKFLLSLVHIPDDIKIGLYDFNVAAQIVNIADDAIQVVFDKLGAEAN